MAKSVAPNSVAGVSQPPAGSKAALCVLANNFAYMAPPANGLGSQCAPFSYLAASAPAVQCQSVAALEAGRQIDRLKPYLKWAGGRSDESQARLKGSITSAINLLCGFSSSNLPIPTASVADENSSLFLTAPGIYGDIEISDDKAEYFLKWTDADGATREIIDEEPIEGERIPPKLLVHLFHKFARY